MLLLIDSSVRAFCLPPFSPLSVLFVFKGLPSVASCRQSGHTKASLALSAVTKNFLFSPPPPPPPLVFHHLLLPQTCQQ